MEQERKTWLVTDEHYLHENVKAYCGRPDGFEETLFRNLSEIPETDVLISLGDTCMGRDEEVHRRFIEPLRCRKVLVKGNHNQKSNTWYLNHGWDFVCDRVDIEAFGKRAVLTHMPLPDSEIPEGALNIHGHWHNKSFREKEFRKAFGSYDVLRHARLSVELTNYRPVLLERVLTRPADFRVTFTEYED